MSICNLVIPGDALNVKQVLVVVNASYITEWDAKPIRTPWGNAQTHDTINFYETDQKQSGRLTIGKFLGSIETVTTAGHGGVRIKGRVNSSVPKVYRKTWYEEDCDAAQVLYFLHPLLKAVANAAIKEGVKEKQMPFPMAYHATRDETCLDELKKKLKRWSRPEYDLHFGHCSVREDFDSDFEYQNYKQQRQQIMEKLYRKPRHLQLKTGDVIEFKTAFQFTLGSQTYEVKRFTVIKDGRAFRFTPKEEGIPEFYAHLTRWKEEPYTVLGSDTSDSQAA